MKIKKILLALFGAMGLVVSLIPTVAPCHH